MENFTPVLQPAQEVAAVFADVFVSLGAVLVVAGIAFVYWPAALVVAGAAFIVVGLGAHKLTRDKPTKKEAPRGRTK